MASGALFGGASSRSQSKNLVEFRAGKMYMKGKMVHPDKRKGLVYVHQSDDSLMHFCWKDRTSGTVEDDLIIFPDDIEFKLVQQCTTGRVYVLKFKSSTKKFFFWMQEPKTDKDDDHCKKVNEYLNNPPAPGSSRGGGSSGLPADLTNESDLQNILGNLSQQQLMQLLGGLGMGGGAGGLGSLSSLMGGRPSSSQSSTSETPVRAQSSPASRSSAATTATTTADTARPVTATGATGQDSSSSISATPTVTDSSSSATPKPAIQLSDLQSILSNMAVPEAEVKEPINLAAALNPESIIPILANADVQAQLIPFLPEGEALPKTEQELRDTVQSPQFQQALSTFGTALQSGELGPLIGQFGLGDDVTDAAAQGDLEAFVKAMQGTEKLPADTDTEMKDDEKKDEEK